MADTLLLNADGMPVGYLPLSALTWKNAIKLVFMETVTVLHEYDDWVVHSPSIEVKVPAVVILHKKVRHKKRVVFNAANVFLRDRYTCQYCGCQFHERALTQDHVIPRKFGGTSRFDNIVTACSPCNGSRGHDQRIRPKTAPYKPDYWEMVQATRQFTINVPHVSWGYYIGWPESKIRYVAPNYFDIRSQNGLVSSCSIESLVDSTE